MSSVFNWKEDKSPSVMLREVKKHPSAQVYKPTRQPFRPIVEPRKDQPSPSSRD
jgi:hypothetical protein